MISLIAALQAQQPPNSIEVTNNIKVEPTELSSSSVDHDVYVVIGNGLPIPWAQAKQAMMTGAIEQPYLLLKRGEKGLQAESWKAPDELGQTEDVQSQNLNQIGSHTIDSTELYIDRKAPVLDFSWPQPVLLVDGRVHVKPDSQLAFSFADDSLVQSWKAFLNQNEAAPPDLWPQGENRLVVYAQDRAGNPGKAGQTDFFVDGQPPEISCSAASGAKGSSAQNDFYTLPLSLNCQAKDASGIDRMEYSNAGEWLQLGSEAFEHHSDTIVLRARDQLGQSRQHEQQWKVDQSPPKLTLDLIDGGQIDGEDVILQPGYRVHIKALDDGVGVASVVYHYNDREQSAVTGPIRFVDRGWYILNATAVDHFGHESSMTWQIRTGSPRSQRPRGR